MKAVNTDKIHESRWDDGTPKSADNGFNWKAPRTKVSPLTEFKAPQTGPMNTGFNVSFSSNTPGALTSVWGVMYVNE